MFEISTQVTVEAAHRIPRHPKCGRLHGHTYTIIATLRGTTVNATVNGFGFIADFGDIKGAIHELNLDHHTLIAKDAQQSGMIYGNPCFTYDDQQVFAFDNASIRLIDAPSTTAEHLSQFIFRELRKQFPQLYAVTVKEGPNNWATYTLEGAPA